MRDVYGDAKKRADDAVKKANREGRSPYLPVLDDIVRQADIKNEVSLGLLELPLSRIVGNKEKARNNAFACNFMPLFDDGTEFAMKWSNLYDSVAQEGVREAIKVYEYMNEYYVQEGNKRVSVSHYCGSEYLTCDVTRLIPVDNDTKEYRVYMEYLRFYEATGNYLILLSEPGSYEKLADLIGQDLDSPWPEDLRKDLKSAFYRFRKQYLIHFPGEDDKSTSNAFFLYLMMFPFRTIQEDSDDQISKIIKMSSAELRVKMDFDDVVTLSQTPEAEDTISGLKKLFTGKKGYTAARPLRVGFVYDDDIEDSRWIDSHEAGRLYVEEMTDDNVITSCYVTEDGPEGVHEAINRAVADQCEVIFTVTEDMLQDAKRVAVENPNLKILNCSVGQISPSVRCYYGRFYEAAFLTGVLAADYLLRNSDGANRQIGNVTPDFDGPDKSFGRMKAGCAGRPHIGYIRRTADNLSLNAFAIGVSLIDPECRVLAMQSTDTPDGPASLSEARGIRMLADIEYSTNQKHLSRPGLYEFQDGEKVSIATPYYSWGKFYVKIVQSVLSGAWEINELMKDYQAANYWFGLNAGVVDVRAPGIPAATKKLLAMLKSSITNGYDPFDTDEKKVTTTELLNMNGLQENIKLL